MTKKIKDREEYFLDITNEYIKNERPKKESENILNMVFGKLKSRTNAFTKKVKYNCKDFNTEFDIKKARILELKSYR